MTEPIGSFSGLASGIQWRDMIDQIVQLETQRKLVPLQSQATLQGKRKDAWNSLNTLLGKFADASKPLSDGSAFAHFSVTGGKSPTSDLTLFTASASEAAGPGTYSVEVRALAQQEKLRANAAASATDALGYSGSFTLNGKDISISAGDSLTAIRDKINTANGGTGATGVTASIVDVSDTEHYLTLTADETGTNGIRLTDSGGVLGQLGISTGSQSVYMSSSSTRLAGVLGLSTVPPVRTIVVDGTEITVDLQNDTLQDVMNRINAAAPGTAQIVTGTGAKGKTTYSLSVHGNVSGKSDDADTQAVLGALGFTRQNQIAAGGDARVRIDGLDVVRSSNSISDALAGITLDLQSAEVGQTVKLAVGRDADAMVKDVKDFATAFNAIVDFQDQQRQSGAPLYANSSVRAIVGSLKDVLLSNVPGIAAGDLNRLGSAGVALTKEGKLEVDTDKLKAALTGNFAQVRDLFGTHGTTSGSDFSFVSGTDATQTGDYAVQITHAATLARVAGSGWSGSYVDDGAATTANQLTISDAYVSNSVTVDLKTFNTVDSLVAELNRQFGEQGLTLNASKSGTNLVIDGTKYGSAANFTVSYARDGTAVSSSPIGLAAATYAGTDVAGTIAGMPANGVGQILTAFTGGTDSDGLSVQYSGTADGASGNASFVLGAAGTMGHILDGYTRSGDGLIALNVANIDQSVAQLQDREDDVQGRIDRYEASLVRQFTAMEAALSKVQSQGSWLASQIQQMQASTGS